nr:chemotaxis protein CheW [Leptolyngbya sp. Prado105]
INIIINTPDDTVSFMVDDIGEVLQCSSAEFEPPPAHFNAHIRAFLKGAYKLDPGFLLVLNTLKILD